MPPVLAALQWIFITPEVNKEVFALLEKRMITASQSTGRPGMNLWQILVLGVIRLTLDTNYDKLHYVSNYDSLTRQILGQPAFDMTLEFKLSTLKENIPLMSAELLEEVNAIIVRHGRKVIEKKDEPYKIKVDSYVLETNVHFPTDLNLALDCARKCIVLTTNLCEAYAVTGWRKSQNWISQTKKLALYCSRACRSGGKNKSERVGETVKAYLGKLYQLEEKVTGSIEELNAQPLSLQDISARLEIGKYHELLIKHIFLIYDRLVKGETIDPKDKLYSIFEQHTEWINKGKSRPNVELGRRLLIATDQHGLIHDYKIMTGGNEAAEVIPLIDRLFGKLGEGNINSLSSDKGFSKIEDRELLELFIENVVMPKKGKLSQKDKERQSTKTWKKLRNQHSAIESNINCLEHHGLNRCPDKGYAAYERYVGFGVLSYNLHKIGNALLGAEKLASEKNSKQNAKTEKRREAA